MTATPKDLIAATLIHDERGLVGRGLPIPKDWPQDLRDQLFESGGAVSRATWEKQEAAIRKAGGDV